MADFQIGMFPTRFVDKRRVRGAYTALTEENNYDSIASMKTRLTALKPAAYTAARLNSMTANDLQYALRLETADSAGIK